MRSNSSHWLTLARGVLAALLLSAQSFAFAHEIDHGLGADTGACATCYIGSHFEHAAAASQDVPPTRSQRSCHGDVRVASLASLDITGPGARAPPTHS